MGCLNTTLDQDQQDRNREIEKQIRCDAEKAMKEVKLLLLGTGECGKSTILKQMTIIHGKGFSEDDRRQYIPIIISNLIDSINVIINAMDSLEISLENESLLESIYLIERYSKFNNLMELPKDLGQSLISLWLDRGILKCYSRSSEYQLNDSAAYFLDSVERIIEPTYIPTEQDILRSRVKTTGIIETHFHFKDLNFQVFDVGGQRSERKKWMHCFEGVTAILFLVAMSEYDLKLKEDPNINRMHESMKLFDSISNSKWFVSTSIILFLNKKDLFAEKILVSPLKECFEDYTGNNSYNEASRYIQETFEMLNKKKLSKTIYTHFTCATDTNNVQVVFDAVIDVIIKNNLKDCGLF